MRYAFLTKKALTSHARAVRMEVAQGVDALALAEARLVFGI